MHITYVDSVESLHVAVHQMAAESTYLAIDTEFRREDTYFPQLCLIQVATSESIFLIDTLAIQDLSSFFKILQAPSILKVFHSGRQDLEIFCHLMKGEVTTSIFDTQIAAMLIGYGESAGFESLVLKLLGTSLDKSSRHTDWTKRPLTEEQKSYAINDVLYLKPLYEALVKKLIAKGRLEWMKEEVKPLERADFLITVPAEAWRKLSVRNSSPRYVAIFKRLMEWREFTAQKMNIPRSWLLKDEVILELASRKAITREALNKVPQFPSNDEIIANEVLEIVQNALMQPVEQLDPTETTVRSLSKAQQSILEILKLLLKVISDQLDLNPKLIAEKEELIAWVLANSAEKAFPEKIGWRYEAFWQKAEELVEGKLKLHIQKGKVVIVDA